ncbi:hypothetical protein ACP70R_025409 [Stipagrostis hirtigluma subsp. patula]
MDPLSLEAVRATKAALREKILEAKVIEEELLQNMTKGLSGRRKMLKMEQLSEEQIKKVMAMPWPPAMPVRKPEPPYDKLEEDDIKLVKNLRKSREELYEELLFNHVEMSRIRLQVLEKEILEVEAMEKGILEEGGQ